MYFFAPKFKTFDKYDKEKIKRELNSAYAVGRSGKDKDEATIALRAKVAADISALERAVQVFNYVPGSDGLHKHIRDHLVQDRKWLAHYDKCLEQTKKGFEQLKIDAKTMVEEAFAAGEISAEKALALRLEAERAKQKAQQEQNAKNKSEQDKKIQNGNNQHNQGKNQEKNRNNDKSQVVIVKKMVVKEVASEKKDKKNKDKAPKFYQLKPN